MGTIFVYELIDPITDETRYIGITKNPNRRYREHLTRFKTNYYKVNWIKNLLGRNLKPIMNIIDEILIKEASFWERHYISLYKSWNCKLTNYFLNGENYNEMTAKLISNSLKGRKQSPESTLKKLASRRKYQKRNGFWSKPGTYEKIYETRKNKDNFKHTKKSKLKISLTRKKRLKTGEIKLSIGFLERQKKGKVGKENGFSRSVVLYDLNGNFINCFESIALAAKFLKVKRCPQACNVCKGKALSSLGYIWRYENPNQTESPNTKESVNETISKLIERKIYLKTNMKNKQTFRWS